MVGFLVFGKWGGGGIIEQGSGELWIKVWKTYGFRG